MVAPAALSATPASAMLPPSSQSAAETATIAKSPALRSTFSWALPLHPASPGSRISVRTWPSWIAVMKGPTWKSSIETTRSPSEPTITTFAFSAEQTADRSSAASAWASEPPIVPRFLTGGSAIISSASMKSGNCRARSSDSSSSRWRVMAPIRTSPSTSLM